MTNEPDQMRADSLELCPYCNEPPVIGPHQTIEDGEIVAGTSIKCVNKMCAMRPATFPCAAHNIRMFYGNWNSYAQVLNTRAKQAGA